MANDKTEGKDETKSCKRSRGGAAGPACGGYGLAFLGALIYYIQHADNFGQGVVGFLKALVWPAFLIHRLFDFLHM